MFFLINALKRYKNHLRVLYHFYPTISIRFFYFFYFLSMLTETVYNSIILYDIMYYNLFITEVNMSKSKKTIRDLLPGQSGVVTELASVGALRRRIIDMGITPGAVVTLKKVAPMGDPIEINVRGYELSIRKEDAKSIIIEDCEDK